MFVRPLTSIFGTARSLQLPYREEEGVVFVCENHYFLYVFVSPPAPPKGAGIAIVYVFEGKCGNKWYTALPAYRRRYAQTICLLFVGVSFHCFVRRSCSVAIGQKMRDLGATMPPLCFDRGGATRLWTNNKTLVASCRNWNKRMWYYMSGLLTKTYTRNLAS